MDLSEVVKLFVAGYAGGIILSVLPFLMGSLIGFSIKLFRR